MSKRIFKILGNQWGQRITLLLVIVIVMLIFQQRFFRISNIYSILLSIAIYGTMACGMLFVILVGGIDLCQGSTAAMAAVILIKSANVFGQTTTTFIIGAIVAIAAGALLGLFHGIECAYFKVPAFVLTLATQYTIYGLLNVLTEGVYIQALPRGVIYYVGSGRPLGIPMPIIIFILCSVILAFVLSRTKFGRRIYAVGGNPEAASLVGIKSKMHIVIAYIMSGIFASLGGIMLCCMNLQASYVTASGYHGNVLTAMVVGGVNLAGGEGSIAGAIFGALLVGIINNIMILLDIPADYQLFVQGVIIVCAVALNMYTYRRSLGLTGVDKHIFDDPGQKQTLEGMATEGPTAGDPAAENPAAEGSADTN